MRTTLIPLAVLIALAMPAAADDCVPTTSTSDADTTVVDSPTCSMESTACYVVVDHPGSAGCPGGAVWVYPEANGRQGLQRGDECHDDTCGGQTEADVLLP